MKTFKDLYIFLQNYSNNSIIDWLELKNDHFEKQESLLRLLGKLQLIEKLEKYIPCNGNFNKQTIQKIDSYKSIFYDRNNRLTMLNGFGGDISDLTCIHRQNEKNILIISSKNRYDLLVGDLDIGDISFQFEKYKENGYSDTIGICVPSVLEFKSIIERSHNSSADYVNKLKNAIFIDWTDLDQAFQLFRKYYYNINIENIDKPQQPIFFRLHQIVSARKTLQLKKENVKNILWGHVQRSGKSYIIACCILENHKQDQDQNYLIITTAPNETIHQYLKLFEKEAFRDYSIQFIDGKNKKPKLSRKNIIICSMQFLNEKQKSKTITWLNRLYFEMRFIDESHKGGTTELSQMILNIYGKDCFTVHITATYAKPSYRYDIPTEHSIFWDLEDISLCKHIYKKYNLERLIKKHTLLFKEVKEMFSEQNIINEYSKYPTLEYLTDDIIKDTLTDVLTRCKPSDYGWSLNGCFLLTEHQFSKEISENITLKFQNENAVLDIWYRIFGKKDRYNIHDTNYPKEKVFMHRIKKIREKYNSKSSDVEVIMAFLPSHIGIDKISKATIELLQRYNVAPDYDIISINSKITNKPKDRIKDAVTKATLNHKKGVLVLSGTQCSLGVTISECDIVILLNNSTSYDLLNQMIYRGMSERTGKNTGFVIDMTFYRSRELVVNTAQRYYPNKNTKKTIEILLDEKIIRFNSDRDFSPKTQSDDIYKQYLKYSNVIQSTKNILTILLQIKINLTDEEKVLLQKLFKKSGRETIQDGENKLSKGISNTKKENKKEGKENKKEKEEKEEEINIMEYIVHIIPILCILTIHKDCFTISEMMDCLNVELENYIFYKNINIKEIINIYLNNTKMEYQEILKTIKDLFRASLGNPKKLSQLIDSYLIPLDSERKSHAEISTPYELRQEMLNKMPKEFWTDVNTVFEPCSGKGGFLIDIVDKFMEGLKDKILDEKERYKTIVEKCLYFSDINTLNIYICKLLLDPNGEHKLNYNEGNTLELDVCEKWGVRGFDAVIGNPPYNSMGRVNTGNTIWQKFTRIALEIWLNQNGYLVFVHPCGWRKPESEKSKYRNMFRLMTTDNHMLYLEIHNSKDGLKVFKVGTSYDWYIIQKRKQNKDTIVVSEDGHIYHINMNIWNFLPNGSFDEFRKLLKDSKEESCPIIYNRSSYGSDKTYISKTKSQKYKYPIIHTIPKTGIRLLYSSKNNSGHFGVSKIIFSDNGLNDVIIDLEGKYGMSEQSMAIQVSNFEEAKNIKAFLLSENFKNLLKVCKWSNFRIDWRLFTYLKKNFWREFI